MKNKIFCCAQRFFAWSFSWLQMCILERKHDISETLAAVVVAATLLLSSNAIADDRAEPAAADSCLQPAQLPVGSNLSLELSNEILKLSRLQAEIDLKIKKKLGNKPLVDRLTRLRPSDFEVHNIIFEFQRKHPLIINAEIERAKLASYAQALLNKNADFASYISDIGIDANITLDPGSLDLGIDARNYRVSWTTKELIGTGVSWNILQFAVFGGDLITVEKFFQDASNTKLEDCSGRNLLHLITLGAARRNQQSKEFLYHVNNLLLKHGIDPSASDRFGMVPLDYTYNSDIAEIFLNHGYEFGEGRGGYFLAQGLRHFVSERFVSNLERFEKTDLAKIIAAVSDKAVLERFLRILSRKPYESRLVILRRLEGKNININAIDARGRTALMNAVSVPTFEISISARIAFVRELLRLGADVNQKDSNGLSAIDLAETGMDKELK